jgi:RNA polymerase sigma-70 factor (ECF subfamily)
MSGDTLARGIHLADRTEAPLTATPAPTLEGFLASVERRAFVMARLATGQAEDAHDIVQEAMLALVKGYRHRAAAEWGPLFHTILQSRIRDWARREKVRRRFRVWFGRDDDPDDADPLANVADTHTVDAVRRLQTDRGLSALEQALHALPARQQQAFLLRVWEGLDVAETAQAMRVSPGSVKTHYSRAVHALREQLKDHWHDDE